MLKQLKKSLDKGLETVTALVMGLLVLDVVWQVITRFVLKNPSNWTEELATYLLIWVGLLGAGVALRRRAHLGIDYFVLRLDPKSQFISAVIAALFVTGFAVAVLLVGGIQLVSLTFKLGQTAPATGIKLGYVYLAVPISGFFIVMYGLEILAEAMAKLNQLKKTG
ncbi:MAG: TRAP transporter small permease [Calditrichaeota bacterium]|nr:TRAP transporter small permease [Calditrichota bacterium]MCB0266545.1 TRAP transporter small permease [Calditrichota bacterium]